jgi:chemotaxis protein MotA
MELDLEILHKQAGLPVSALSTMADSLPGLGIVAAVLGVVITMSALGGPPEEIGHKVAAALVGTFLGILLCYGFLGPMAANLKKQSDAESEYLSSLRMGLLAYMKGMSPILALEAARRAIPPHVRPTFKQMDDACRKSPAVPAAEVAA